MHSVLFLSFAIMLLNTNISRYVFGKILHDNRFDPISNNIEMLLKPIKKISGIFPNHEFELQFDLEPHMDTDKYAKQAHQQHPSQPIIRSKNISIDTTTTTADSAPESSEAASDPDNPIVYMKDLKNALEEYEKKHATGDFIKKDLTTESPNLLSSFNDNPALSDVLQLIKRGAKLQNEIPTPGDSDLSWIKIRVPTAWGA